MKNIKFIVFSVLMTFLLVLSSCSKSHKISTTWKMDATNHWHTCTDCEELFDQGAHTITLVDHKDATCTEDGYDKYQCSVCGYEYKNKISKTNHSLEKHEATSPDCVTAGNTEYYSCSKCSKYYSDAEATTEIAKDSWVINPSGHTLTKVDAVEATRYNAGNIEYYTCSECDHVYADQEGTEEITDVIIPQIITSVADAKNIEYTKSIIVRGIVIGVAATNAGQAPSTMVILKDENSNAVIGLNGGVGTATKLSVALGTGTALEWPWAKGTIIEVPVTVAKASWTYANGNSYVKFLSFNEEDEVELSSYVKGTATNLSFDLTDPSIETISTQSDFFKFLGLKNGSNDSTTEGFEYDVETAGNNSFKIVKLQNLEAVLMTDPTTKTSEYLYWRPMFGAEYDTWAKSSISNSATKTNNIGAKQSFYPVFWNYNTYMNTGKTFSELVFGDTSSVTYRDWTNHTTTSKDVYCIFIGGNDYYCHFVILDTAWVISHDGAFISD